MLEFFEVFCGSAELREPCESAFVTVEDARKEAHVLLAARKLAVVDAKESKAAREEAAGGEEESRVFGIDLEIFAVLGLDGCGGGKGKERTARNAAHEFDCVTWAPSLSVSP